MKTSFYFALWILIYPLLDMLHNDFISQNSFFVALIIVWGVSALLPRLMPNIYEYEALSDTLPVLEEVYTGNVEAFKKRVSMLTAASIVTAIYFIVTIVAIMFMAGFGSLFSIAIFGFFTYAAIKRSIQLNDTRNRIYANPTPEECAEVVDQTFQVNYEAYYSSRCDHTEAEMLQMLPQRPAGFTAFQIISLIIATCVSVAGIYFIILAIPSLLSSPGDRTIGSMFFLYGTLATFYGIKDLYSIVRALFINKTNPMKS